MNPPLARRRNDLCVNEATVRRPEFRVNCSIMVQRFREPTSLQCKQTGPGHDF